MSPHTFLWPDAPNIIDFAAERRRRRRAALPAVETNEAEETSEKSLMHQRVVFAFVDWPWDGTDMVGG